MLQHPLLSNTAPRSFVFSPFSLIWVPFFLLLISLSLSLSLSLSVSIFLPFFIYNLPHTPSFSNSISVSCFGRTCWASAKAIMRTVKQRQMNRWERRREKERETKRQRERERHEYEVLALLWLLTVHSRMHGHTSTRLSRSLRTQCRAPPISSWPILVDVIYQSH